MYTPWLREGPLYKSVLNKCKGVETVATIQVISGPLLNSGLRRLFRYGIPVGVEKVQGPICGHLFESSPGPLFMSSLGPLAR